MFQIKINFARLKDILSAAENLQNAGKDKEAKDIVINMAKDILKSGEKNEKT